MSYLNTATYRGRERQWRDQAERLPPGPDRDACQTLADGYRHLVALLDQLDALAS